MKKEFITPQFIRITNYSKNQGFGNSSNLTEDSVHEVHTDKVVINSENALHVKGVSAPVRLFSDEYSCLWPIGKNGKPQIGGKFTEEEIENFRKEFEKNQKESKKNAKFAPTVNSSNKKRKMSKTKKEVVTVEKGSLTATEMKVMEAIIAHKSVKCKKDDKAMVGKVADLDDVDSAVSTVDVAKVCRKLKRAGLVSYNWSFDKDGCRTGAREVGVTKEGFEILQLPVKEKQAPKSKKEAKDEDLLGDAPKEAPKKNAPKKAPKEAPKKNAPKKAPKEAPKKNAPYTAPGAAAEEAEEGITEQDGVSVKVNAKDKSFTVTSQYGEHRVVVKTLKAFKELKEETADGWLTRIENGELEEL